MKTVKLFVVQSEIHSNGKINQLFFNSETTFEDACIKEPCLKDRKILSAQNEDVEVMEYGKSGKYMQVAWTDHLVDINGKLAGSTHYSNPNDDELMRITMSDKAEMEGNDDEAEFWRSIGE